MHKGWGAMPFFLVVELEVRWEWLKSHHFPLLSLLGLIPANGHQKLQDHPHWLVLGKPLPISLREDLWAL